jgi:hypothetical protein
MIDASHEPFEKNVEITRKVVEYAHKHNCSWNPNSATSSAPSSTKAKKAAPTPPAAITPTPRKPSSSSSETGCDSLAIAIGNSHGAYKFKGEQHLDIERLKAIKKALMDANLGDYPLVLHGASSVPQEPRRGDQQVRRHPGRHRRRARSRHRNRPPRGLHQGQHRHRPPHGHDRRHPQGVRPRTRRNSIRASTSARPASTLVKDLVRHKVKNVLCCAGHAFD